MANPLTFLPMILNQVGPQRLERVEEPQAITSDVGNVQDYDKAISTLLSVNYGVGLEAMARARSTETGAAIDLACGPAHFSLSLLKLLGYQTLTGIDLSPGMIQTAKRNARLAGVADQTMFRLGDITRLESVANDTFDLANFGEAAHHMPSLDVVRSVLREMDRITKPSGLVVLMDVARLRTAGLTERYVQTIGEDYLARGLVHFFEDFRNSMYAAWTTDELHTAIPTDSRRVWCHVTPRGLPTLQMIFGLPVGRETLFVRKSPWSGRCPVASGFPVESGLARLTFFQGATSFVPAVQRD